MKKKNSKIQPSSPKKLTQRAKVDVKAKNPKKNVAPTAKKSVVKVAVKGPAKEKKKPNYKFRNYFESENQLKCISHKSDLAEVIAAYTRLIWVYASNHVREGVEIEDLIAEGKRGVIEAYAEFNDRNRKKPNYNFYQACLYKIRSCVFQYCLRNATQIKTPYYIQRGCMHVGQIFKLMANQSVAEALLKRRGPPTEQEVIDFIYDEKERLPLKGIRFIKKQITKKTSKDEFQQILNGILNHELGSRHSYVKNNLTDVGKVLHIKEKMHFTSSSNNMDYKRVIDLIMSARQSKLELNLNTYSPHANNVETEMDRKELIEYGKKICGEKNFNIFLAHKLYDKNYEEIAHMFEIKKDEILDILKKCLRILRKDSYFQEAFNSLN